MSVPDPTWPYDRSAVINAEMVPPAQRGHEQASIGRQHRSAQLQAGYLLLLIAASAVATILPGGSARDVVAAGMLVVAVVARVALAYRGPTTGWVRARLLLESAKAEAWRRAVLGNAEPGDSVRCRMLSAAGPAESWARYRLFRIQERRDWFRRHRRRHRRSARRLQILQALAAAVAVAAAVTQAAEGRPPWVALVSTLLAAIEAWNQFRRNGAVATGYARAEAALTAVLERPEPPGPELSDVVTEVERILDQERWAWASVSAPAALAPRATAHP